MPRYTLRTLLILLAIGPPVGAGWWLIISRNPDPISAIAFLVCLLIGAIAAGPILITWAKENH